jgi:hypothetical protein
LHHFALEFDSTCDKGVFMARISDDERSKFRDAAEAARAMLVKLQTKAAEIQEEIARCEHAIEVNEMLSGQRKARSAESSKKRGKKGQIAKHIDAVLADGSVMTEPEIRSKIKEIFGEDYGRATVYTALWRGGQEHKYLKDGKKWKLSGLVTLKTA